MSAYEDAYEKMPPSAQTQQQGPYYPPQSYYGNSANAPAQSAAATQNVRSAPALAAPQQAPVGAHMTSGAPSSLQQATEQAQKAASGSFEAEQRRMEAELHGGAMASKLIHVGAQVSVSDLDKGVMMKFNKDDLMGILQVHPRNNSDKSVRVGEIEKVFVTHVSLYCSFNNHTLPVHISSAQLPGKRYPLTYQVPGRRSGRNNRFLMSLMPGSNDYGTKKCVYQRIKTNMLSTSQRQVEFDLDEVQKELSPLRSAKPKQGSDSQQYTLFSAPENNLVARMITTNEHNWRLDMTKFPRVHEHGLMLIPRKMAEIILDMLRSVKATAAKNRVDLSGMEFYAQSACMQSDKERAFSGGEGNTVYISWEMYMKYVFMNPDSLHV